MMDKPNYLVWSIDEVTKVTNQQEQALLNDIIDRVLNQRIQEGKSNNVRYIVIPSDKPYYQAFSEILGLIQLSK